MDPLGPHSYDPGVAPALTLWTVEIPEDSVEVDLDSGEAVLDLRNVCSIFDAFTVANSIDSAHPLGLVSALLKSLRIEWSGILHRIRFSNATTRFSGRYVETSARIAVTVETPATHPPFTPAPEHGFKYTSDPAMTISNFAQIGHERNGALFA